MDKKMEEILISTKHHITTITLNTKLNLFTPTLFSELKQSLDFVKNSADTRVVILNNAKDSYFSAGLALKHYAPLLMKPSPQAHHDSSDAHNSANAPKSGEFLKLLEDMQNALKGFREINVPVLASIDGDVIGAGLDLISYCDIRFATKKSKVSLRETKIAIVADLGSLQRLPQIVGNGKMRWMALTGGDFDANWCLEANLFDEVLEDRAALDEKVWKVAEEIASNSPLVVQGVKRMINFAENHSLEQNLEMVKIWNAAFLHSDDLREAILSFMQKRKPTFRNRL